MRTCISGAQRKQRFTLTDSRSRSISSQHLAVLRLGATSATDYDNGSSLLSGEYKWSVAGSVEMALFGDGGNVYSRLA